jgi:hypothetical protein
VNLGRTLIVAGALLIVLGLLFLIGDRLPIRFGRLPGDIVVRGRNGVFYFPIVTCILLSAILSLVFWLIRRH